MKKIALGTAVILALLSVVAAVVIRTVYVITTSWGKGRSVFWSPWFFARRLAAVWFG